MNRAWDEVALSRNRGHGAGPAEEGERSMALALEGDFFPITRQTMEETGLAWQWPSLFTAGKRWQQDS